MPALLAILVDTVKVDPASWIRKCKSCELERDSAVLALVLPVLSFIPIVAHRVYTYHITKRSAIGGESGVGIIAARCC